MNEDSNVRRRIYTIPRNQRDSIFRLMLKLDHSEQGVRAGDEFEDRTGIPQERATWASDISQVCGEKGIRQKLLALDTAIYELAEYVRADVVEQLSKMESKRVTPGG